MKRPTCLILLCLATLVGCSKPEKPSIYSSDPSLKIPALKTADSGEKEIKQMVKDLDSDDPAIRFYTINRLTQITGNSFGYRYYDDEIRRRPALKKWQQWLAERAGTTQPATTNLAESER